MQGNEIWGLGNGYYSGQSERDTQSPRSLVSPQLFYSESRQNSTRRSRQGLINDGSQEPVRSLFLFIQASRTLHHRSREHPRIFISRFNTLTFGLVILTRILYNDVERDTYRLLA